jgi:uncharacterized membrane protein
MKAVLKYLVERLAERTTWVGILAAAGVALALTAPQLEVIGNLGSALAAAILIFGKDSFLADKKDTPPTV